MVLQDLAVGLANASDPREKYDNEGPLEDDSRDLEREREALARLRYPPPGEEEPDEG